MTERTEALIIRNLIFNEEYCRKVLPFINPEYFDNIHEKIIFEEVSKFIVKYNSQASKEVVLIEAEKRKDLNEETYHLLTEYLTNLENSRVDLEWLVDTTEKWCRDQAIYLALTECIQIADGDDGKKSRDSIPSILQEALSVSFDQHVGHDLIEDYQRRYDYYTRQEEKIPFDLDYFNKITGGGLSKKTVFLIMAPPNTGKSLAMCSFASGFLAQNKNVLYISLEMSEEKIAKRIDANLLNVNINKLEELSEKVFEDKIIKLANKTHGKLIIKEYPTSSAHVGHFRGLLNELELKKHFKPDVIFIDYLNICASSKYKSNSSVNSYTYVGEIIKEMRALAFEADVPIVSATQTGRAGSRSTDPDMTDVSDSFASMMTADIAVALIKTEELDQLGQLMFKQIRNRDNDNSQYRRFVVGVDKLKMRLYDVEQSAQVEALDVNVDSDYDESSKTKSKFSNFKF
jgi:replicative DNA helicase